MPAVHRGSGDDRRVCKRLRLVETDQDITGIDPVALPHAQLSDNAACGVLNLLDVRIHHDHALGDHGARQLGRCRPTADTERHGAKHDHADNHVALDGFHGRCHVAGHRRPRDLP